MILYLRISVSSGAERDQSSFPYLLHSRTANALTVAVYRQAHCADIYSFCLTCRQLQKDAYIPCFKNLRTYCTYNLTALIELSGFAAYE